MLDYYFCEECETYHQPNRFINGQILSACQCQISTQPSGQQQYTVIGGRQFNKKQISYGTYPNNTVPHVQHTHINFNYLSPTPVRNNINVLRQEAPRIKYDNRPFRNNIQANKISQFKNKIIRSPQKVVNKQFMSPMPTRQIVQIKKSISPSIIKRSIATSPQRIISSPLRQRQGIKVVVEPSMNKVQRISQVRQVVPKSSPVYYQPAQPVYTNVQQIMPVYAPQIVQQHIIYQAPIAELQQPQPQFQVPPPPIPQSHSQQNSNNKINMYSKNPLLVLDRVSQSPQIIQQRQQDACCGKMCYH